MRERVEYDDHGHLDEVVTGGGAHLEAMDADSRGGVRWFLSMTRADGSEVCLWIDGRVTLQEERGAPTARDTREGE